MSRSKYVEVIWESCDSARRKTVPLRVRRGRGLKCGDHDDGDGTHDERHDDQDDHKLDQRETLVTGSGVSVATEDRTAPHVNGGRLLCGETTSSAGNAGVGHGPSQIDVTRGASVANAEDPSATN